MTGISSRLMRDRPAFTLPSEPHKPLCCKSQDARAERAEFLQEEALGAYSEAGSSLLSFASALRKISLSPVTSSMKRDVSPLHENGWQRVLPRHMRMQLSSSSPPR